MLVIVLDNDCLQPVHNAGWKMCLYFVLGRGDHAPLTEWNVEQARALMKLSRPRSESPIPPQPVPFRRPQPRFPSVGKRRLWGT
jgi:hypothetical protein